MKTRTIDIITCAVIALASLYLPIQVLCADCEWWMDVMICVLCAVPFLGALDALVALTFNDKRRWL